MTVLNVITCLAIVVAVALIMLCHRGKARWLSRLCLACIAGPYLLKVYERVHGDEPTLVDVIRDLGLLGFLVVFVYGAIRLDLK